MDFDFSDLHDQVNKYCRAVPRGQVANLLGADLLAFKIAGKLLPYLRQVTCGSDSHLLQDMESLYARVIELSPYRSMFRVAQGQFYFRTEQFDKAVLSFQRAYDIEFDPTRKTWPHLQPSESNARIMIFLGRSLCAVGRTQEALGFLNAGQKMIGISRKSLVSCVVPEPH